jgi:hypothetical protein
MAGARMLLGSVSPRVTIAALMGATLVAAVLCTISKTIRQAPSLDELTNPSACPTATGWQPTMRCSGPA